METRRKPLLLRLSGKDYLWGGSRLNDEFEKNIDMAPLAETPFYKGNCIFVPADSEILTIHGQAQFLDVRG